MTRLKVWTVIPAVAVAMVAGGCVESTSTSGPGTDGVQLVQSGKLLTCAHLPYVPFQYKDGDKVVGFDVDVVDFAAKKLNVPQQVIDTPFDGIKSGADLNSSQCDVVAGAITINATRAQNFDFTIPYFEATQALLTKTGNDYKSLDALAGKKVGVQSDTTGEDYIKGWNAKHGGNITAVAFEDSALLEAAVKTGQVDASINDNGILYDYAKKNPDTQVSAEFNTNEQYGFGVKKGNAALLKVLNDAIKASAGDGTYAAAYEKWFGRKPSWQPGDQQPASPTTTSKG
ncbi:ABC transporter substrate-binding protein [Kutzneria buriramensis]|uniref:Polar amino acid transport system substrate-binding protein n=1 Tax=Kutzneria buriramensis TaxID=1045776 RepID=A0A3E0HTJ4_9PSEU|nr:ABC transporter substrate-binding protein [Kutzneria buriramensis]REH49767.1 polar amino acid transport system substrate-binding protein [Kutzneria buriramensis]